MQSRSTLSLLAAAFLALPATAQLTLVAPPGYDTAEGNSNNIYPWGRGTASMRVQFLYDSTTFTGQNVAGPVLITRLRYRADAATAATTWAGGSWPNVRIDMATAAVDYAAPSSAFASNLGPDLATVHNGLVTVAGGTGNGAGIPGPWIIDIALAPPFLYNPSSGSDLVIDIHLDGTGWTGAGRPIDHVQTGGTFPPLCTRVYDTSGLTSGVGTVGTNYGAVCEFSYMPPSGYAFAASYGTGCVTQAGATFYETFPNSTFDLSNTSLVLTPTPDGYIGLPGGNQWFTPTSAPIALTDDSVTGALPLGFTLNYPGGSTTNVYASSNGFVWAQSNTNNGCCAGDPGALRSSGARWCLLWNDLNPGVGGTVQFDTDPTNGAAYVTYTNVPEYGQAANLNTFQIAFFNTGSVEYRWQGCTITAHVALAGWSPGAGNLDPGPIDISTTPVIITSPDLQAIQLGSSARPVIGTTLSLNTTRVPSSAVLGATLFGLTELNPGLDLTPLGMPGCYQYLSIDASSVWVPAAGVGSTPFVIPNFAGLAGVQIKSQGAALVPGINTLGALSSNGLRLVIDVN